MKLIYISHWRFPAEKTHAAFAMKTCEMFASSLIDTDTGRIFTDTGQINADKRTDWHGSGLLYEDLTYKIRGAVFNVYNSLGFGHKESVYQRALEHEFRKVGVSAESQKPIDLIYDDQKVGVYRPDLVVENKIVVELKSSRFLTKEDQQQVLHYLKGTGYELALLINFGAPKLQIERLINTGHNPRESGLAQISTDGKLISADYPCESDYDLRKSDSLIRENPSINLRKSEKIKVELWVPRRNNRLYEEDPFLYHGIEQKFIIRRIPVIDFTGILPGTFFFFLMVATFQASLLFFYLLKSDFLRWKFDFNASVFYFHDARDAVLPRWFGRPMFLEIHDFYKSGADWLNRLVFSKIAGFIVTNRIKMRTLTEEFGIPEEKMLYQPNAVDLNMFAIDVSQNEARAKLGLPGDKKIILYTGHLFGWKGVDTLFDAHKFLGPDEVVYFVGGTDEDIAKFKSKAQSTKSKTNSKFQIRNVVILGRRPHLEIPLWLRAADILVLPNTAKDQASKYETSPVKLFEYMASGTPIASSDLPSLRDILDERIAFFFRPDDPRSLAEAAHHILGHPAEAHARAKKARERVKNYTWERRTESILNFVRSKLRTA